MISKEELCKVYRSEYFDEGEDNIVITENNLTNPDSDLKEVSVSGINGRYLKISSDWLKDTCQPYQAKCNGLSILRKDCDSVFLFTHNEEEYIVWMELKSGFDSATSKAMFQLIGSSIRSKSYLNAFPSFSTHERHELCVVVSHPDDSDAEKTEMVKNNKRLFLPKDVSSSDRLSSEYRRKLRAGKGRAILKAEDFLLDKMPIADDCKFKSMPLLHLTVEGQKAAIDVSDLLKCIEKD